MAFRELIVNNFWWKFTALLLAVASWLGFHTREGRPPLLPDSFRTMHTRYLVAHPITISKPASDPREFRVTPSHVDITLSGEEKVLRNLADSEVRATVDISDLTEFTNTVKIRVFVPPQGGIKLERLSPDRVQVELLKQ